ncbi:acyltransferase family protein [Agrobacterium tumefaciens]|uniref:acyltransferase family protein n=1 Tax=Agrobacterium tumefaciens TaxID=358 RepID=UPI0021D35BF8|nr:acyltransferase [Agrobacterium tumefaciens]UXS01100.1 acyltransferase [Agrobacterium tumefaciens]
MRNREIYLGIDVLRFIAAIMVMAYHLGYKAWSLDTYYLHEELRAPDILWSWSEETWFGWVGVQIFFVISGFVIAFSSENSAPSKFIVGRIARLAPVMWISATICLAITLYWQAFPVSSALYLYAKSITFFPFGPWIAGQIWTLPIEIMFYGLMLALLIFRSFDRIAWVCLAVAFASAFYWLAVTSGFYEDTTGRLTQLFLLQHGCYFALGVAFWLLKTKGASALNVAVMVVSLLPTWVQIKTSLVWEKPGFGFDLWPMVPYLVWAFAMFAMAGSIYWNSYISRVLTPVRGLVMALGRITYPLYLVHFHVGGAIMLWLYPTGVSPEASIALAFAGSIAVAFVIAQWIEKPIAVRLSSAIQSVFQRRVVIA